MEQARNVLSRLDRIDRLDAEQAPARVVLAEVRALVSEVEAWLEIEPAAGDLAAATLDRCRRLLEVGAIAM